MRETKIERSGDWLFIKNSKGRRAVIRIDSIAGYAPVYDHNGARLRIAYGVTYYDIYYDSVTYQEQLKVDELLDNHIKQLDNILGFG